MFDVQGLGPRAELKVGLLQPRSTQSSALKATGEASERKSSGVETPPQAGSAAVGRDLQGVEIGIPVMLRGGQSFPWGLGKDLLPFPPGWSLSLA